MEITEAKDDARAIVVRAKRTKRQWIDVETETDSICPSNSDENKEEVFIANCLLLLAQGGYATKYDDCNKAQTNVKFTSRKFMENGKYGHYVYECKTCGKSFPSFQALGGHRASHKKPRNLYNEDRRQPWDDDDRTYQNNNNSPLSLRLSDHSVVKFKCKSKMHICATCGAQFTSGQALGGHMRRHRSMLRGVDDASSSLNPPPNRPNGDDTMDLLSTLDLNLPAIEEEKSMRQQELV